MPDTKPALRIDPLWQFKKRLQFMFAELKLKLEASRGYRRLTVGMAFQRTKEHPGRHSEDQSAGQLDPRAPWQDRQASGRFAARAPRRACSVRALGRRSFHARTEPRIYCICHLVQVDHTLRSPFVMCAENMPAAPVSFRSAWPLDLLISASPEIYGWLPPQCRRRPRSGAPESLLCAAARP